MRRVRRRKRRREEGRETERGRERRRDRNREREREREREWERTNGNDVLTFFTIGILPTGTRTDATGVLLKRLSSHT